MPKKLDRKDLESMPIPPKVLWAVSEISAFLGEALITHGDNLIAWGSNGESGYFVYLSWGDGGCKVSFDPPLDADWKPIYQIIGYCAYHGIGWEAP